MMKIKKNPKKDLTRNSGLFFIAGLTMVLALTYVALEWKSFYATPKVDIGLNLVDELEEPVDLFTVELPPPPKPIVTPPVIEIVPDETEVPETIIEAVEPDQNTEIIEVSSVDVEEIPEDIDVPFSVIENVPVFPGCENSSDKRECFNTMMLNHISKTFRYPEIAQEMGVQGRVSVMFTIQKDGSIGNVRMRGPDKNLEKEAARIISKLPKMTPGKQRGNAVRVPFSIPITFKLK